MISEFVLVSVEQHDNRYINQSDLERAGWHLYNQSTLFLLF